jgi:hypothetical protein
LQVLEDASRTRHRPARVTYNTANAWLLVEAAERLFIDRLVDIAIAQEKDGRQGANMSRERAIGTAVAIAVTSGVVPHVAKATDLCICAAPIACRKQHPEPDDRREEMQLPQIVTHFDPTLPPAGWSPRRHRNNTWLVGLVAGMQARRRSSRHARRAARCHVQGTSPEHPEPLEVS